MTKKKMPDEEVHEFLAVEIHTALRKYVQDEGSADLWDAINENLPAYNEAIEFAIVRMGQFGITMRKEST